MGNNIFVPDQDIELYTDGGCRNLSIGGFAGCIFQGGRHIVTVAGYSQHTTNNRMELMGIIASIEFLDTIRIDGATTINLYSDSQYCISGCREWLKGWKKKGYKGVKNPELWKMLDSMIWQRPGLRFHKVKGHSGNPGNELADEMANYVMDKRIPYMVTPGPGIPIQPIYKDLYFYG